MRWDGQLVGAKDEAALPGLRTMAGLVRTVRTPEFAGIVFHEVTARSVLNRVPAASRMPFRWTVNPFRGCSHACVYCYARSTHTYLDMDAGADFDSQIVVKVNAPEVLARELAKPSWEREQVALGTNTDPYQRAEGRYRLMPGIIGALVESGTPLSVLTKGTLLRRDLPLLGEAAAHVPVSLGISLAVLDAELQQLLEPGTPSPRARLDLVRAIRETGLDCHVMVAPVLPWVTDLREHLDALLAAVAEAGATSASVMAAHLRPGVKDWYLRWLQTHRPALVPEYQRLYGRGAYAPDAYRTWLAERVAPLLRRHGLARGTGLRTQPREQVAPAQAPDAVMQAALF
ncbi:Rv2578c family radical SAM protein [Georgenia satyanarayanai]|uniref:Rv2578c family radical SAM protein n=1 Tax=Georgenia satyanarayanai TaxID=860221 RepID=UPI00203D57E9|nr:Rv2578c family radical SAM protein [Georgenia satyanarayanai]MCM3662082.1 Rv2578c family radical SAM protein [Georgenia satyanarayanai]